MRNPELNRWIKDTKRGFYILRELPLSKLKVLGDLAGLDMNYYKTKIPLIKALMIRLCFILPNEMKDWK